MTGNGIESDFVLPDSLFISDYSTLPAFYQHFGANCRFFCTISMLPDSSTPFASRTRGAASGLRQRVFDPLDSRSRDSVGDALMLCPRADPVSKRAAPACRDSPSNRQHYSSRNICWNCECPLISACLHFRPDGIVAALIFRLHPRLDFSHPRKSFHAKNFSITRTEYTPSPGIPSPFAAAFLR